ncbi:MAG: hypothetical protein KH420_05080, partial [Clostridiales bacterium]|nr:hypothetical protein [Clostridiales bacterium]
MRHQSAADRTLSPHSGRSLHFWCPPEVTCHRNYFYQKCFFNDGSHLLFAGEFDGHW